MRTPQFESDALLPLFRHRRIVTMQEMKAALGTTVDRTVLRKLQELPYLCSYSHRGKFYTLDPLAAFDDRGLWTFQGARFSRFGTLIDTAEQFVTRSDCGYLASELAGELQAPVKEPLRPAGVSVTPRRARSRSGTPSVSSMPKMRALAEAS